jgi:hypothetical protein
MSRSKGVTISSRAVAVILIALILFGAWFTYYEGYWSVSIKPKGATVVNQYTQGGFVYTVWSNGTTTQMPINGNGGSGTPNTTPEPIYFTTLDPLNGGVIGGAYIYVFDQNNVKQESLTTDGTATDTTYGAATTSNSYYPGTSYVAEIVKTNYVTRFIPFTVPSTVTYAAYNTPVYKVQLPTILVGSYSLKCVDSAGNSYSSGGNYSFGSNGVTSQTFTFTLYESTSNEGWWSSYDIINAVNQNTIIVASTGSSYVTVTGGGTSYARGTTTNYVAALPDGTVNGIWPMTMATGNVAGLTRIKVGNNYISQGICSESYTFGKGSITTGTNQTISFYVYDYADPVYFGAQGIGGPNAAQVGSTFNLVLQG